MTELKGWHVLSMLLSFFGVTIGVNAYFITVALTSSTGEYQKKSYLQGLHYNDVIDARARQRDLGWTAELSATPGKGGVYDITILILDQDAKPLDQLNVVGALRRPVQAAMDRSLSFESMGRGLYRAQMQSVALGKWQVSVIANDARARPVFRAEKTIWLR